MHIGMGVIYQLYCKLIALFHLQANWFLEKLLPSQCVQIIPRQKRSVALVRVVVVVVVVLKGVLKSRNKIGVQLQKVFNALRFV